MDFHNKIAINGVYLQKMEKASVSEDSFAEVVMIIPGIKGLLPQAWRFSRTLENINSSNVHQGTFVLLGDVVGLQRGKKEIYLSNQSMCRYRYLVLLPKGAEAIDLSAALLSLQDALKISRKTFEGEKVGAKAKEFGAKIQAGCRLENKPVFALLPHREMMNRFCEIDLS